MQNAMHDQMSKVESRNTIGAVHMHCIVDVRDFREGRGRSNVDYSGL
jgi:hypothetical protein